MMGNLARALDERHKVMHSSGKHVTLFLVFSLYDTKEAKKNVISEGMRMNQMSTLISGFPASVRRRRENFFLIGQLQHSPALIGQKI